MAKEATKIQEGEVVDYTATGAIANGDIVPLANRIGVAYSNAVSGDSISLGLEGVFEVTATTADAIVFGAEVYFNSTSREITTTASGNTLAGFAVSEKSGATAGTILVKIG